MKRDRRQLTLLLLFKGFLKWGLPMLAIISAILVLVSLGEKDTGCLLVTAEADSAVILLNGSAILQKTGELVAGLKPGNITVSVHKQGYRPYPAEFLGEIAPQETLKVHFTLIKVFSDSSLVSADTGQWLEEAVEAGMVRGIDSSGRGDFVRRDDKKSARGSVVVTSNVPGAEIWRNGELTGLVTNATFDSLPTGKWVFSVKKAGFQANPESLTLDIEHDLQTEIIYFSLKPVSTEVKPALTVKTTPVAGAIFLDGEQVGVGESSAVLKLGRYTLRFGEVKNFLSPEERVVELTSKRPVQAVTGEYIRLMGNSALAVLRQKSDGLMEANYFRFYLDDVLYFGPENHQRQGYLFDNLLAGRHIIKFTYDDMEAHQELELSDGMISTINFTVERAFNRKNLKLRISAPQSRSKWMRSNALLDIRLMPGTG